MKRLLLLMAVLLAVGCFSASAQVASQYTTYRNVKGDRQAFTFNIDAESPVFTVKGFEVAAVFNMLADMFISEQSAPIDRAQYDAAVEIRKELAGFFPVMLAYGGGHTSNGLGSAPSASSVVSDSSQSLNRQYVRAEVPYDFWNLRGTLGVAGWYRIEAGTSESTDPLLDIIAWNGKGIVGTLRAEYTPEGDTKPTLLGGVTYQRNQLDVQLGVSVSTMLSRLFTIDGDSHWSHLYTLFGFQNGEYSRIGNYGDDVTAFDVGLAYNVLM